MAVMYVSEYVRMGLDPRTLLPAPEAPPIAKHTVTIGVSSAETPVFNAETRLVRVHVDVAAHVNVGVGSTATSGDERFAIDQTEFRAVPRNSGMRAAVLQA